MANRTIGDFTRSRLVVPDLAPDMSGANLMNMVSNYAGKAASEAINSWQKAEVETASSEGKLAGTQENVTYRPGSTLTAQAYNKAAQNSQITMTELHAQTGMARIAEMYKDDPAGYQAESADLIAGISDQYREAGDEAMGNVMEAKMKLTAQGDGYRVAKAYNAKLEDQHKGNTEKFLNTLKVNTFKASGAVFSPDPTEQGIAITKFVDNFDAYATALHAQVGGKNIYSGPAIEKRLAAFRSDFYVNAMQDWVTEADITEIDMVKIRRGEMKIPIAGRPDIDVMSEIGVDEYKSKVVKFTDNALRDKKAAELKQDSLDKEVRAENRKVEGVKLISGIFAGSGTTTESVIKMLEEGKVDAPTAKAAIKMIRSPQGGKEDSEFVTELKVRQIKGEDITAEIQQSANMLSAKDYNELMIAGAKVQSSMQREDERSLIDEVVQKDKFGREVPSSLRLAADLADTYRQNIEKGMDRALAVEEARNLIDVIKAKENKKLFKSIPRYSVTKGGQFDVQATAEVTRQAYAKQELTDDEYYVEMKRIEAIETDMTERSTKP